jgi:diguanylate cyclase (GGDEF)-like protein
MSSAPNLLICDHRREGLLEALEPLEQRGFHLTASRQVRDTVRELAHQRPDAIVIDPLVPGGRAELEEIRRSSASDDPIPVLLVAEPLDPRPAARALEFLFPAACDLVYRSAPLEEFILRIEGLLARAQHGRETEELRHRALHDDRTDLLRPHAFQQRLTEHFSAAQRHHFEVALVLIDLDEFGAVNKRFDHTVGDLLIAKVGDVIRQTLRTEDVAGRIGGDEFAAVLPYTGRVDAAHVVRRLRDAIATLSGTISSQAGTVEISASLGFETFDGTDIDTVETLRQHAELALREAKRTGGHRAVYYRSLGAQRPA